MDLKSLYATLNPFQAEVVFHLGEKPLLVLAGAGSGKTRVIALRIAHLIHDEGFKGSAVLGFTFTNKAAGEMAERVTNWLGTGHGVQLKTFHSFGAWFLRLYAPLVGASENFSIWDGVDMISALKSLNEAGKRSGEEDYRVEAASWRQISSAILKAKEAFWERREDLEREFWEISSFVEIFEAYERHRRNSNAFDFSDLIRVPVQILQAHSEVKAKLHARFRAIFVDEYQDTNYSQFLLLKELCGERTLLCAVGDEDQCIYGFRGARLENILQFQDNFKGTKIVRLEENYRSSGNIIAATSGVIARNKNRLGKILFTNNPTGKKLTVYKHETSESEARFWADKFSKIKGDKASRAVIYRTNAQSLSFEKAFREAKVPYRVIGALKFYEREEIKDALAYLKCIDNPQDQVAFLRVVNKPARGLGKKGLEVLIARLEAQNFDVWLTLKEARSFLSTATRVKLERLLTAVDAFRDDLHKFAPVGHTSENLAVAMTRLFLDLDLFGYYKKLDERELTEKLLNLEEFISSGIEYNATPEELRTFLENTELAPEREEGEGALDLVINPIALLTAHASKGLEFDEVLISGMEEGLFPLGYSESGYDSADLEEERRLFYVAMTRAREMLSLSFCDVRVARGKRYAVSISPFLKELPPEVITVFKTKDPLVKKVAGRTFSYGAMRSERQREHPWSRGDLIFHTRWGEGEILDAWQRKGELFVRIAFEDGQERVLMPEYEKLEKS